MSSSLPLGISTHYLGFIKPNQNLLQARLFLTIPFAALGLTPHTKHNFLQIGFEMNSLYNAEQGDIAYYFQESIIPDENEYAVEQELKIDSSLVSVSSYTDLPSFYQHIILKVEDLLPEMINSYLVFAKKQIQTSLWGKAQNEVYGEELKRIQRFSREIISQLHLMKNNQFSSPIAYTHSEYEHKKTFEHFMHYWSMISFNEQLQKNLNTQLSENITNKL